MNDLMAKRLMCLSPICSPSIWSDEDWDITPTYPSGLSISEDEKNVYIEVVVAGIDPKNIDMTFDKGYLWIKGQAKEEETDKNKKYYRKATKSFSYRMEIPGDIDTSIEPSASYKHGLMTVTFVKSPKSQPKKIQLKG